MGGDTITWESMLHAPTMDFDKEDEENEDEEDKKEDADVQMTRFVKHHKEIWTLPIEKHRQLF